MATFGLLLIGTGDECLHLFVVRSLSRVDVGLRLKQSAPRARIDGATRLSATNRRSAWVVPLNCVGCAVLGQCGLGSMPLVLV